MATPAKGLHLDLKGRWTFRLYTAGTKQGPRRKFILEKGTTRAEAVAAMKAEQARAAGRAGKPIQRKFTVAELAQPYLDDLKTRGAAEGTLNTAERIIRCHIVPAFGPRRIVDIRPAEVEAWLARRVEGGAKPSSVNLGWRYLRALVRRSVALGWLPSSPWPPGAVRPRPTEGGKTDFLTPQEWDLFSCAINDPLRWEAYARTVAHSPKAPPLDVYRARLVAAVDVFRVQLGTASRPGEIVALTWGDVDLEAGTISIRMPKVRRAKLVPMSPTSGPRSNASREASGPPPSSPSPTAARGGARSSTGASTPSAGSPGSGRDSPRTRSGTRPPRG